MGERQGWEQEWVERMGEKSSDGERDSFRTWAGGEQIRDTEGCMVGIVVATNGDVLYRLSWVQGLRCLMERGIGE
jgi:hypothetical protein